MFIYSHPKSGPYKFKKKIYTLSWKERKLNLELSWKI